MGSGEEQPWNDAFSHKSDCDKQQVNGDNKEAEVDEIYLYNRMAKETRN